jgi:RNA polymerase sigma-70 factor (ECF subfamily)
LVYYRIRSRMDAEDLTQEIFMEMTRSLGNLRDSGKFKAWLYRISLNKVRDFKRKRKIVSFFAASPETQDDTSAVDLHNPLDQMVEKEFWQQFHGLIQKMSKKEREVFLLRYIDQLRIREISETLRSSESAVKTHLYRALQKFKGAPQFRHLFRGNAI